MALYAMFAPSPLYKLGIDIFALSKVFLKNPLAEKAIEQYNLHILDMHYSQKILSFVTSGVDR